MLIYGGLKPFLITQRALLPSQQSKMNPTSGLFGSRFVQNPFFLLAGALLFDEKIRQRTALFWFGLRDVGILHSRAIIQRTIVVSPTFLEHSSAKKIAVCAHTNHDPNKQEDQRHFCIQRLITLNSFQILKTKIENKKSIAVDICKSLSPYPLTRIRTGSQGTGFTQATSQFSFCIDF